MENSVGRDIRLLSNLIHRMVMNSPVRAHVDTITGSNAWIIGYIGDHQDQDVYQRDIEKKFGITRSTTSKVVNLMEQKGLIRRESVPGDARLKKLVLTDTSMEIYDLMEQNIRDMENALMDGFSEEETEQFVQYLGRVIDNLKKREDSRA